MATLIIAHRGGAALGTENSLSCIEKGIDTGAHMVEVDLHLTADNRIVVCHDQRVDRTTNGHGNRTTDAPAATSPPPTTARRIRLRRDHPNA